MSAQEEMLLRVALRAEQESCERAERAIRDAVAVWNEPGAAADKGERVAAVLLHYLDVERL